MFFTQKIHPRVKAKVNDPLDNIEVKLEKFGNPLVEKQFK